MADSDDQSPAETATPEEQAPASAPPPASVSPHGGRQSRLSLWILLGIVAVIVIAAIVLTGTLFGGGSEVPDLTGLSMSEATAALENAGLLLGKIVYTQGLPTASKEGDIVGQMPPAGKQVEKGTEVDVIVARGAQ
jgi:serine/threonine-protein kinase